MRRPFLKSLGGQLTLAFMLLSLLTLGLTGVFSFIFTRNQYSGLLTAQLQELLVKELQGYYATHGTVEGFTGGPGKGGRVQGPSPDGDHVLVAPPARPPNFQDGGPFYIADSNMRTLTATTGRPLGARLSEAQLRKVVPVHVSGRAAPIAYLVPTGNTPPFDIQSATFVNSTQRAIFLVMMAASVIAVLMGVLLAKTLLLPLSQLLSGIQALQRGEAVEILPNLRQDEVGELLSAFNVMSQELARSQKVRRQLTADIAHDLNTPLSVISGSLEGMIDGTFMVSQGRLEGLHRETLHVTHLIRDLRFLALADAGELNLQRQHIDLWQVVREAVEDFEDFTDRHGVHLTCVVPERSLTTLVDPTRITQVIRNLLSNAVEHTPDTGYIEVQGLEQDGQIQISVRDSGVGISADMLPYVFERLYRASVSRGMGGSGLGLSISRSLIEAHGGHIRIASDEGRGTDVTITLPRSTLDLHL